MLKNFFLLCLLASLHSCSSSEPAASQPEYYTKDDFKSVKKIDAHVHVQTRDSSLIKQAEQDNVQLVTVNYDDINEPPPMEDQQEIALYQVKRFPERIAFATTISVRKFNMDDWLNESLAYIKNSISQGAKAVKIYKVIGMSLRDTSGKLVMIDDPRFDPLFDYLEKNNIPVIGHLGEPRNSWLPADKMTVKGDISYLTDHPEYHMYLHPEMPSYEDQIRARDNMLEKHPKLRFVGAHLGSLEWNVDSLAARLDKFPNMAVDMASRIVHLEVQAKENRQKVVDFITKYNDRLLYATDLFIDQKTSPDDAMKSSHETWISDWKFFTSDDKMQSNQFQGDFLGLKLPKQVIDNIYHKNARRWLGVFINQ
jgi:predicted TIM-barrel fold metal-dependent hydrolase